MIESMERIDVLKGIEQILVQKAYEAGHISHRADGDWQKQADGSWIPYTGQSAPQTQETAPTENTEYGEITEEDLKELNKKDLSQHLSNMHNQAIQSLLNDLENGKITEDQFKSQMSDLNNNITTSLNSLDSDDESYSDDEESSGSGVYGDIENYDFADLDDYNSMISSAFNAESGIFDDDDELTGIATQYAQDHDIEDTDNNINWIRNKIMGHAERLFADDYGSDNESVGKSAVRDMRSAPTTKNMGF